METSALVYQNAAYLPSRSSLPTPPASEADRITLYSPFLWLFRFLIAIACGKPDDVSAEPGTPVLPFHPMTGAQRRYFKRVTRDEKSIRALKQRMLFRRVFSRGLSRTRYIEKSARLFHGRIRAYRLNHWAPRRQREAGLSCHDHGTWSAPDSSAMCGGVWDAQLPPD